MASLAWVVALAGCELTEVSTGPTEDVLVVEATLRTDEPVQRVLLHRSIPWDGGRLDDGAEVTVSTGSGAVVRFEVGALGECVLQPDAVLPDQVAAAATCFVSPGGMAPWVHPGETYELSVRTSDGLHVRGRTTTPGAFRLLSPSLASSGGPVCRIPPETTLPLVWTVAEGAWVYMTSLVAFGLDEALAGSGVEAPARLEFTGVVISGSDTTRALPGDFVFDRLDLDRSLLLEIQDGFPEGTRLELTVAAAERNYVNALRPSGFHPSGNVRISSVVGDGVGYFGALVPLDVVIHVTADDRTQPPCAPGT